MLYHFLCHNPVSFILQFPNILEIFGFNLIDFMCFGDKRKTPAKLRKRDLFSIAQKSMVVFFI